MRRPTYHPFLIALLVILATCHLFAQNDSVSWEQMILNPKYNFFQVRDAFYKAWEGKRYQPGSGYEQFKRWEYLMETTVDSNGIYDDFRIRQEFQKFLDRQDEGVKMENASCSNPNAGGNWSSLGPFGPPGNYGVGRVNVVAFHPTDSNMLWVGAPAGGLWKSADGGMTWTTNTDTFPNLGISDIAIHPTNPDIMYVGTGDRDGAHTYSFGLIKSVDGGINWTTTSLPISGGLIHRVLIHPTNPDVLLVATSSGIWRSDNAGTSWTQVNAANFRALEFNPANPDIVYAATSPNAQFFRSMDGGLTFSLVNLPPPSSGIAIHRFAIATTANNPAAVILLGSYNNSNPNGNSFNGIYKSSDNGGTFTQVNVTTPPFLTNSGWSWTLAVSPSNQEEIYAGGGSHYKSINGGMTWAIEEYGGGVYIYGGYHFAGFQPGTNTHFIGCDVGVFKTPDSGNTWINLSDGLSITQFYSIAASSTDPDLMLAGAAEIGTLRLLSGNWETALGSVSVGRDCIISHNDDDVMFASTGSAFFKSMDGGNIFDLNIDETVTGETGAGVMVMDPTNSNILYAGYESIWKTTDQGATWTNPAGPLTTEYIEFIAIAPSNTSILYATDYYQIWKSTNAGASWSTITDPGNAIRSIAVHATDPNILWACVGDDVYKSTNGGTSWTNIAGNLPNIPMRSIVHQPNANNALYVGAEVGVYFKNDLLADWELFSDDLPNVRVDEVQIFALTGKIRAATFGRGLWESDLYCVDGFVCNTVLDTLPYALGFETNLGAWEQDTGDDFDWTRLSGPTPTANTGPDAAFEGSYYLYVEATDNTGNDAILRSPCINATEINSPALFFRYHMFGTNIGTLSVEVSTNFGSSWTSIWSLSGNQGNDWRLKSIDLSAYNDSIFLVRFKAVIAGDAGDIALDDIHIAEGGCGTVVSTFPYVESFESGFGAWTQSAGDDFDWTRHTGAASSYTHTGPAAAYEGSWYLFANSTLNFPNKTTILTGPCFNLTYLPDPVISFSYHMFGLSMGTLILQISTDDGLTWTTIWSKTGNQGNAWFLAPVSLAAYANQTVKFRFKCTTGSTSSIIAIDKVRVFQDGTLPPDCTTLTNPAPGGSNVPVNAALTWAAANLLPAGYRLDVGTTPGSTDILNNFDAGNVTTYNPPGDFAQLAPIYIKIKPYNANGEAVGCPEQTFTTGQILTNPSECQMNIAFPDNACLVSNRYLIDVTSAPGSLLGADVYLTDVKLIIQHPSTADLDITLTSPSNVSQVLSSDNGGSGDNYGNPSDTTCASVTNFNMSAGTYITSGTAPFIGSYRPEGFFSNFHNGTSPIGQWTLEICDDSPSNVGNLDFVELVFGIPPPCTNLTAPVNGETNVPVTSALTWAVPSSGNPTGYRLDIGTTPGGTQIYSANVGNITTFDPPGTFPYNTTIYVKIKPYNAIGVNLTCLEESFTTQIAPPSCTNLTDPVPGATNIPITAALTWAASAGSPTGYRLDVGTTSGGTQILNDYDVGNVTTFNPPGDFPYNTFIYVKIKPYNGTGSNTSCAVQSFRTQIAPPGCTTLSTPANGATNVAVTTALSWSAASGSPTGYRLDVGTTSGGTDILNNFDVGLVTTYNPPGDLPYSTTIYVKITPYNGTGSASGCLERSFTTQIPPPDCTNLTDPSNGEMDVAVTAALNWAAASGAPNGYRLDVGYTPGGTQILNNYNAGNVITFNPAGNFLYDTTIYVKIKPYNNTGSAVGCLEDSFTTQIPLPGCTSMNSPVPGSTNNPVTTSLGWAASSGSVAGYRLDVGTTSGGTQILNDYDVGNVTSFDPPGDLPFNTFIYVRVKPYNGTGTVTNCTIQNFKTQIAPPACTSLSSPANGATNVAVTSSLTWTAASGSPTGYRLDVGTTSGGTDILDNFDVGLVTTYNPPGDFPYSTTIYVTVTPYNGTGSASNCIEKSFTTVAPPPPSCTTLSSPANGALNQPVTTALTWVAAGNNPTGYRLDVGTTSGGTDILNDYDVGNITTFNPSGDFPAGKKIYVKIKPYNPSGATTNCTVENFTTQLSNPSPCLMSLTIPDNGCMAAHQFEVNVATAPGTQLGANVFLTDVKLIVEHNTTSDLDITLISPNNVAVLLTSDNGGTGNNYGNPAINTCASVTDFKMSASTSITAGTAPFVGAYIPEGDFAAFHDGSNPVGLWTLEVCDDAAATIGNLDFVELVFAAPPACTNLTSPVNGATNVAFNSALTWATATGNPTGYRLDAGTTPGGTDILNNFDAGNVTTYNPPGDFPSNTTIYLKIKPYNTIGTNTGCSQESFTTVGNGQPVCTNLTSPANGASAILPTATLTWAVATGNPTGYRLDAGTTSGGTDILNNFDVGNVTTFDPAGYLPYSSTVYVKIKPYNANGESAGCPQESFGTASCIPNLSIVVTPVPGGSHRSLGNLNSHTSTVATGTDVEFTSDTSVSLEHDFIVELGGLFQIVIQPCPTEPEVTGSGASERKD